MAIVVVSHNITRVEDFEGSPPGTFGTVGGGPGAGAVPGLQYQSTQAIARRIGSASSERGFTYTESGTRSMLGAGLTVVLVKVVTSLSPEITSGGSRFGTGNTTSAYYNYQIGDDGTMAGGKFALPPKGGYVILPIEVRKSAWHNLARVGSPDVTIIDVVRVTHNVATIPPAGDTQAMDAWDLTDDGLFLVGGDSTDPDGTFQDFVDADEGEGLTGADRSGLWTSTGNTKFAYLLNVVGRTDAATVTATVFTDSFFSVVFPQSLVGPGVTGLEFDLGNASTVVTISDGTISGEGRSERKVFFDTELDVIGGATDTITITAHGLEDGDQVAYSAEGGTEDIGPDASTGEADDATSSGVAVTGDNWYVMVSDADTIQLTNTAADAYDTAPTAQGLTASAAGNGENHSLTRKPDTRPDVVFTSTSGSAALTNINLVNPRVVTLTSAVTCTNVQFVAGQSLTLGDATLEACTINAPTTSVGESYLTAIHAIDLDLIDNTSFVSGGEGHATEITTNGTVPQDVTTLSNVSFSGYYTGDEDNTGGWSFNASTDVSANQVTITGHGWTSGDPVFYSDEGGTQIVGLVDQTLYYLEVVDANTVEVHPTGSSATSSANTIGLTAGSSETHKFYSANAAFFNNTGTDITVNVSDGGTIPTVRNGTGATTTVLSTVPLTVRGVVEGSLCYIEAAAGGALAEGVELMKEYAVSTGLAIQDFNYTADQPVTVRARNSGLIIAAIEDDGGVNTDRTALARDRGAADFNVFPASPVVNVDQFYWASIEPFTELKTQVDTAGAGGYTLTWEYWNGAWVTLTTTQADDFSSTGNNFLRFAEPGDWAVTAVSGVTGSYYYVRVRWTAGSMSTSPIGAWSKVNSPKYFPFEQSNTITSTGLNVTASWVRDNIAT